METKRPWLSEVDVIATELGKESFTENPWWVGIKGMECYPRRKDFMLQMAENKAAFIRDVTQLVWSLFESKRELLESTNHALACARAS